ncbi:MAG: aminotransferase class III-fold pyridoxal phosphate-dependent enzyme [Candidatus Aminicenantes bacterium]
MTPLGHSNPRVSQAISDQAAKIIHCGYYNGSKIVDAAARELLKITGINRGKSVFLSSGSEAVEFGIKATHKATEKNKLLRLHDSF